MTGATEGFSSGCDTDLGFRQTALVVAEDAWRGNSRLVRIFNGFQGPDLRQQCQEPRGEDGVETNFRGMTGRPLLGDALLLSESPCLQAVVFPTHCESSTGSLRSCHVPGTRLHAWPSCSPSA